ncbi:LolA family protein [Tenuibacillus multivorans]|uniref:Outer membrane lipoprotein-sorting protein n=1 Tax=Tenuibacillus multivorans TaxID=237069 RepID=A0A1H0BU40_9BACI|nr:hypothetical protein [Tenuibacillus multivorans]GEL77035.1 hypothetical protein TMU01_12700 [Tenuibacillus multivorans]SDN49106.1 hypothetical protein SAMN05216498_2387 [Tenuibacillus multivorans]
MKAEMDVFKGENQIDDSSLEQWMDYKDTRRTKVITETANGEVSKSVNDGEKVIMYSDLQGEAFEMEAPKTEVAERSQQEQIKRTLEQTRETHDLNLIGEEELNGFNTYHIKAVPKEEGNSLRGEEEYWITTDHWMIVKSITHSDDIKVIYEVTDLNVNPEFDENTFTLNLPEGVEVKPFEEMDPTEQVTLDEAATSYDVPLLTVSDQSYQLEKVDQFYMEQFDRTEVNQEFHKDGFLQFTLSSFEAPKDGELGLGLGEEEEIDVRNTTAVYSNDVIKSVMWEEEGLRYSLLIQNPDLSKEEVIEIVEGLEYVE